MQRTSLAPAAAYSASVLFALHLVTYFIPSVRDATLAASPTIALLLAVLAIAQHLVVFPVVARLPAPGWTQLAGYAWLVIDMLTDLLQLGGAPKSLYLVIRLIINLAAALWIATSSWQAKGKLRGIGVFVAIDFGAYSLLAGFFPWAFVIVLPSLVLLPAWFFLVGRRLAVDATSASHSMVKV